MLSGSTDGGETDAKISSQIKSTLETKKKMQQIKYVNKT